MARSEGKMNITSSTKQKLNDSRLIQYRDRWFERLQHVFANEQDDFNKEHVMAINGVVGTCSQPELLYTHPEQWVVECLENLATKVDLIENEKMFVPLCIEPGPYIVHFVDKVFGAEVFCQDDLWYNKKIETPVGELQAVDLENNETWQLAKRAALKFIEQDVGLPLFGLPTIASALNIAVNLYGEEILVSMMTEPEAAHHDLKIINEVLCQMHQWYREVIPHRQLQPVVSWNRTQPPGYGQLCGCTTQLVSNKLYQEFIKTLDNDLLNVYPNGGMIHLCGSHTQLIESFRSMPALKAIQINNRAAADLERYFKQLREDQMIYLNPCKEMSIEKALEITKGHRLIIADTIEKSFYKHTCGCGICNA